MSKKISCFVCNRGIGPWTDNNFNNPKFAIYLGHAESREDLEDEPIFIHNNSSCINKARKLNLIDKEEKFVNCIVCGHRVNLSEKRFKKEGVIKKTGYMIDKDIWMHIPLPNKDNYTGLSIANCYEEVFGHNIYPSPDDEDKKNDKLKKYLNKKNQSSLNINKKNNKINFEKLNQNLKKLNYETENQIKTNPINNKWDIRGYLSFIFLAIMAFGLFAKWFFLLPFVFMNEYGNRPWFLPATILYFIIMFLLLSVIFGMRKNYY